MTLREFETAARLMKDGRYPCSHYHPWTSDGSGYRCMECGTRCLLYAPTGSRPPLDPLEVEYDGWRLCDLLAVDVYARRETEGELRAVTVGRFTPAQRAAISAHWSAELRTKVAEAAERDRLRVVVGWDPE